MQRTGKILRNAAVVFGVLIALLVLLAVLLPKIISTDSVKATIEGTVAKELGGTATFERLSLAIIPRPRLEVRGLKIEVPGTASVSDDAAKVRIRFLPLLRGRFAVSSATLDRPAFVFTLPGPAADAGKPPSPEAQPPKLSAEKILAVSGRTMPDLSVKISRGSLSLVREAQTALSLGQLEAQLAFAPGTHEGQGPSGGPSDVHFQFTGEAQAVISENKSLPGPLRISTGRFDAVPGSLAIAGARAQLLDMDVTLDGSIGDYLSAAPRADLAGGGSIGPGAASWLGTLAGLPDDLKLRAPLKVAGARLRTSGTGPASSRELTGSIAVKDGPTIPFELRQEPGRLSLKRLQVKDGASDAILTAAGGEKDFELAFAGSLEGSTLLRIFDRERLPFESIKGDIRVRAPRGRWREATAQGTLEGGQFVLPQLAGAFVVERFVLKADGRTLFLRPLTLSLGKDTLTVEGTASLSEKGVALDFGVSADKISFKAIEELMETRKPRGGDARKPAPDKALSVEGELRLRAKTVELGRYAAEAVAMNLKIDEGRITAGLERATICGVSLVGKLRFDDHGVEIALQPQARGRRLDEDAQCLFPGELRLTGSYDLSGSLTARGSPDTLLRSLQGSFDFSAKKGLISDARVVEGVIAYLEKTSVLKNSQSAKLREGVPYDAIALRGTLRGGVLNLAKVAIKSKQIHLAVEGSVDLPGRTLALTVLVAPLTGVDRVLSKIPIVKHITGNALVVVPVRVEGPFDKPEVRYIPASGVSTSILNLMKNIVEAPVSIIEPIVPAEAQKARE